MEGKLNVILDLDNTLLCAVPFDYISSSTYKIYSEKLKYTDFYFEEKPLYRIYLRPYLEDFLDYLFDEFNVSVFTNAEKDYADFVIKNIIFGKSTQHRKLDFVFYRYHSNIAMQNYGKMKDLRLIWEMAHIYYFFPSNTVIIDDLYLVKNSNYYNCLAIKPFELFNSNPEEILKDNSLMNVSKKLFLLKKKFETDGNKDINLPILQNDTEINKIY
jgi:hypothetical protein